MTKIQIMTQQALERGATPEQAKRAEELFRRLCPGVADQEVPDDQVEAFKACSESARKATDEQLLKAEQRLIQRN